MSDTDLIKYRLRFFFDYNCGGCLWSDNDKAYNDFGVGCLDAESFDVQGNIIQSARIRLTDDLKEKVLHLDKLYSESLDWSNPSGESLWTIDQWNDFYLQTRELYSQIVNFLGVYYEVVYKQE